MIGDGNLEIGCLGTGNLKLDEVNLKAEILKPQIGLLARQIE